MSEVSANYLDYLRSWASAAEQILAFDPERAQEWFERARECAKDDSIWPEHHRQQTRQLADDGKLAVLIFRPEFVQKLRDQQTELLGFATELGDRPPNSSTTDKG
jgi:hypothetical protein